jgi:hypothetical protein
VKGSKNETSYEDLIFNNNFPSHSQIQRKNYQNAIWLYRNELRTIIREGYSPGCLQPNEYRYLARYKIITNHQVTDHAKKALEAL